MVDNAKYSFKNLDLWRNAQDFAVEVVGVVDELTPSHIGGAAVGQLIRSASSIAANIAEGHGRYSLGAYRNHLSIARGSAAESQGWLDLLVRLRHVSAEKGAALERRCEALIAALTRRMVALQRQEQRQRETSRVREDSPVWETDGSDVLMFQGSNVPSSEAEEDTP